MTPASFFAHKLFGPIASGLLILSVIGNAVIGLKLWAANGTITTLSESNKTLAGDLRTCQSNNRTLEGAVTLQNTAVDGMKLAAEAAAASAKAGQAAAEGLAAAHDRDAAALGNLPPLPPGADRCAAASALITATLAGEKTK